jgi:3-oxoacyl-[acyl-carrier-protein] synthase III
MMTRALGISAPVVLTGLHYAMGKVRPITALEGPAFSAATAAELVEKGAGQYCEMSGPIGPVLLRSIDAACTRAGVDKAAVDMVILITESLSAFAADTAITGIDGARVAREAVFDLMAEAGLHRAELACTGFGGCNNLAYGLMMAEARIRRGLARHVLVIAAERFVTAQARMMNEALSVASDGVAACIVRSDAPGYAIGAMGSAVYERYGASDMAQLMLAMFRAMRHAAADCYEAAGRQPRDFRWLVLGNYNPATSLTHGKLLGFPAERIFLANVGKLGHVPFDPLIALADLADAGTLEQGDALMMFLCGPIACSAIALEVIGG